MSKERMIRQIDLLSRCALTARGYGRRYQCGYANGQADGLMNAAVWLAEDLGIASRLSPDYFEKKEAA